jgi:SSS family solute:Na+ symporter
LLGLVLVGLLAALMSSIDSTLNSASTLVTMDFVHTRAPDISPRALMWIGRGVTLLFMLLAMAWAPQIANFSSLFNYLQQVLAYAVSPVVAVLVVGVFWRNATADGAIAALLAGLVGGAVLFTVNVLLQLTHIHFLYVPMILFLFSLGVLMLVSWRGVPPADVSDFIWSAGEWRRALRGTRVRRWYQDFRLLSLTLLVLTALIVVAFA